MFRALIWKEWRQLALVRWGGIALGALLPIAFTAGAELSKRGLLPTGEVKAYSPRDLMFELLPAALALGLWPLMALMAVAQAFAADRASGTESFLLERPVPRAAVWRARLAASLATLTLVMVATAALGAVVAAVVGTPPALGWTRWLQWSGGGVAVALLAFLGGLIASTLLTSPMGAVLAGAVLAGIPVLVATLLASSFVHASYHFVPIGGELPVLMLPAYVVASWASSCRGEPAGRGRIKRGVAIAAGSLAVVFVLFLIGAPIAVRASAAAGTHYVSPSRSGRAAFVGSGGYRGSGGWLVETLSGSKRVFAAPPTGRFSWSPDGSELALVTSSGRLGSAKGRPRIDILEPEQGEVVRSIEVPDDVFVYDIAWARDGIVVVGLHDTSPPRKGKDTDVYVDVIDPVSGAWRSTGFREGGWSKALVGPRPDGSVLVRIPVYDKESSGPRTPHGYRLYPVDVAAARVGSPMADPSGQPWLFAGWMDTISLSGRFARVKGRGTEPGSTLIADLGSGTDLGVTTSPSSARWVFGDSLVWVESLSHHTRMFVAAPGSSPTAVREWTDAQVGLELSPDGRKVFISVLPAGGAPAVDATRPAPDPALFEGTAPTGSVPEETVYLVDENAWVAMPVFSDRPNDQRYTLWAGPKTLARIADGVVYFEDIDRAGGRRFVLGGESDLR